jgi:hypothetical protein
MRKTKGKKLRIKDKWKMKDMQKDEYLILYRTGERKYNFRGEGGGDVFSVQTTVQRSA